MIDPSEQNGRSSVSWFNGGPERIFRIRACLKHSGSSKFVAASGHSDDPFPSEGDDDGGTDEI
jgi:hypothetical protein